MLEDNTMVYKNGTKEYVTMALSCGLSYGLMMWLLNGDFTSALISGVMFGTLFTLVMLLFIKSQEKKFLKFGEELRKTKTVICEGPANHKKKFNAIGGWLYLCEEELKFFPHKINVNAQELTIALADIKAVNIKSNQLFVQTSLTEIRFVVNQAPLWKKTIEERL